VSVSVVVARRSSIRTSASMDFNSTGLNTTGGRGHGLGPGGGIGGRIRCHWGMTVFDVSNAGVPPE
jgi:hypothetical protein